MLPWILSVLGWLAGSVAGYLLARHSFRKDGLTWTVGDRNLAIRLALAFGPILVFGVLGELIFSGKRFFSTGPDSGKPSKW